MQLSFLWTGPTAGQVETVAFVRHRRARRYILRVLADGTLRVTLPRWGAKREARRFVEASRDWITKQREHQQLLAATTQAWGDGTRVFLDGHETVVKIDASADRIGLWQDGVTVATLESRRRAPSGSVRDIVETWMRERARNDLPRALLALAVAHRIDVPRVSVRNQRSRWGACSPFGTITLNWRLVQTPPFVREYVLLHELMHRREMNHSRRFWRLVAGCCPRHAEARQWLRKEGKSLWSDRESSCP